MRDTAVLNAAAAIVVGKLSDHIEDAIIMAAGSIDNGKAIEKLNKLADISKRAAGNRRQ